MDEQLKEQILGMVRLLSMLASGWMIKKGWARDTTHATALTLEFVGYAIALSAAAWSIIRKVQRRNLEVRKIETAIISSATSTVASIERKVAAEEGKPILQ